MTDLAIIAAVAAIVGSAVMYIRKQKSRGVQCIGCPDSKTCAGNCSGCSGCGHSDCR